MFRPFRKVLCQKSKQTAKSIRNQFKPRMETLEGRTVLSTFSASVDPQMQSLTLHFSGDDHDADPNDFVKLTQVDMNGQPWHTGGDLTQRRVLVFIGHIDAQGNEFNVQRQRYAHDDLGVISAKDIVLDGRGGYDKLVNETDLQAIIRGGDGNDILIAGNGGDQLDGEAGDDFIKGGPSGDVLTGGDGINTILGGGGTNQYLFNGDVVASDTIQDNGFSSTLNFGNESRAVFIDLTRSDVQTVTSAQVRFGFNRLGKPIMWNVAHLQITLNDPGVIQNVVGSLQNDRITGNNLDNDLSGNKGSDVIFGGGGNDRLFGAEGNDQLFGGEGDDVLNGGNDDDQLFGQAGNDRLFGNAGNDLLVGGDGDDYLVGGNGTDRLFGDERIGEQAGHVGGNDYLNGGNSTQGDSVFGRSSILDGAADELHGGPGSDTFDAEYRMVWIRRHGRVLGHWDNQAVDFIDDADLRLWGDADQIVQHHG